MKYKEILSTDDERYETCKTRVIIERDSDPPNPLNDYDQTFLLHSNIPREFCGNEHDEDYDDPLVEIVDDEGYGTGEYEFRDGVIAFPVAAYIHSGIALSLGSGSHFPDQMWDVTRNAAYLWTDKERFERMNGKWLEIWDEKTQSRRMAKDFDEFKEYLRELADSELKLFQQYIDGRCFGYRTEERDEYVKEYPDGRRVESVEYVDGEDSCWGYYPNEHDDLSDMDAPKGDDIEWFAGKDCDYLVGDKYGIPEFVVTTADIGGANRKYLERYTEQEGDWGSVWTSDKSKALRFSHWGHVQVVAQKVIGSERYDYRKNIREIDSIKEGE